MDFWHALTGKTGTDDARGAQADLKIGVHQVRLFPPVFEELACTSLIHCSDPLESLFETAHNSQLGGLQTLQIPPGFCGFQWFLECAHHAVSLHQPLLPRAAQHCDQPPLQPAEGQYSLQGNHPVTHTQLQLLSIGTKLHSTLAYNLQLIQMPADNT